MNYENIHYLESLDLYLEITYLWPEIAWLYLINLGCDTS